MICAPQYKRPIRSMPEPAQQEYYKRIPHHNGFLVRLGMASMEWYLRPASAQRDIHIIAEPCRQRDMPTTPKLRNVAAEIRHIEVAHQPDTEQLRRTDGYIRIPREVAVNLKREEHRCQCQRAARLLTYRAEDRIHIRRAVVRHHYLLEQAPQYLPHTVHRLLIVEHPPLLKLRQQVRCPLNRSCHQLREETQKCRKRYQVPRRRYLSLIHINGIRQRLKGVETNPHRQHQVQQMRLCIHSKQPSKRLDKEIVILENT